MEGVNKEILSLRNQGKSLREIGQALGMSHVGVMKRLRRLSNPNVIVIEAGLHGFTVKFPVAKRRVGNALAELSLVLEELNLNQSDKKIVIDAGSGWRFEKVPQ